MVTTDMTSPVRGVGLVDRLKIEKLRWSKNRHESPVRLFLQKLLGQLQGLCACGGGDRSVCQDGFNGLFIRNYVDWREVVGIYDELDGVGSSGCCSRIESIVRASSPVNCEVVLVTGVVRQIVIIVNSNSRQLQS